MTPSKSRSKATSGGLPTYTLQAGYDKFVSLPNCPADDRPRAIVPRRTERPVAATDSRFIDYFYTMIILIVIDRN